MGGKASVPVRNPVPEGKVRLCAAGFSISHHTGRAKAVVDAIVESKPDKYESWFYFSSMGDYKSFLEELKKSLPEEFAGHRSSPFCWLEYPDGRIEAQGGRDRLCEWAASKFEDPNVRQLTDTEPTRRKDAFFKNGVGTASQTEQTVAVTG